MQARVPARIAASCGQLNWAAVTYEAKSTVAPTLLLAHGAGAGQSHPWMVRVARGLAARGVTVVTFNFPYMDAHRHVPDRAPVLEQSFADEWAKAVAKRSGGCFAGGKSMGGRIASQVLAQGRLDPTPAGLIFFGYPLHPPGKPGAARDRHLPDIHVPLFFLHGTHDPFGSPDEMRAVVERLPHAKLELIEGGDHSLVKPKRTDPQGKAFDQVLDDAAAWLTR